MQGKLLSLIGAVLAAGQTDFSKSLVLMAKGMVGILLVMCIIYIVIVILNKATGKKKNKTDDDQDGENTDSSKK